jgi:hypothetical protein
MESSPQITVLMPVYNGERFLAAAIESILPRVSVITNCLWWMTDQRMAAQGLPGHMTIREYG